MNAKDLTLVTIFSMIATNDHHPTKMLQFLLSYIALAQPGGGGEVYLLRMLTY